MVRLGRAAHGAQRSQERASVCSSESIYQCERPSFSLATTKRDQMLALTPNTWIPPGFWVLVSCIYGVFALEP